jgi:nucleotide-binding universal stress UspA family protein
MSDSTRPIVVGIDGSAGGVAATRWAAGLAQRFGAPLRLLHARPDTGHALTDAAAALRAAVMTHHAENAEKFLAEATAAAREAAPDLKVTTTALDSAVGEALIDASASARFLVLGSAPRGPLAAILLGSTTVSVVTASQCPVIMVRGADTAGADGPVVVGVDYSETGAVALERAFEVADRLGVGLKAVHAWSRLVPAGEFVLPNMVDWTALESAELVQLTETVDEVGQRFPNVAVQCFLESDRPAEALIKHSGGARLVVVGSRGRGALTGAVFGSTGLNMLQHCRIPLMICHEGHTVP